jgi:transposase
VERALRGVAVGRKNHYGSRSERGTGVAALFYSLIESATLAGIEPCAHLREATLAPDLTSSDSREKSAG